MSGYGYIPDSVVDRFSDVQEMKDVLSTYGSLRKHGEDYNLFLFKTIYELKARLSVAIDEIGYLKTYTTSLEEKISKK